MQQLYLIENVIHVVILFALYAKTLELEIQFLLVHNVQLIIICKPIQSHVLSLVHRVL